MVPERTIERLSLYRRLVNELLKRGQGFAYSHEIATLAGVKSSQVRRDFMFIGTNGRSNIGYDLKELLATMEGFLVSSEPDTFALVGIGNLGRAILAFFQGRTTNLTIKAAFDKDIEKVDRVVYGCRAYHLDRLREVVAEKGIDIGVIAVPSDYAQEIADKLVQAGVRGIVNFAPAIISVPEGIVMESLDLTVAFEKVAHYSRKNKPGVSEVG